MDIQFSRIDGEAGILQYDLDRFAASFNHQVTRLFPIWVASSEGKTLAYCHTHPHIVAYPAIHPDIRPRAFYQLAWQWFSLIKTAYGDPWVVADPISMPKATPDLLSKVGITPIHDLYRIRD